MGSRVVKSVAGGAGTVRMPGSRSRGKGMRNKRKAKMAAIKRKAEIERMRRQRELEAREESWLEEWGHLSGEGEY